MHELLRRYNKVHAAPNKCLGEEYGIIFGRLASLSVSIAETIVMHLEGLFSIDRDHNGTEAGWIVVAFRPWC